MTRELLRCFRAPLIAENQVSEVFNARFPISQMSNGVNGLESD